MGAQPSKPKRVTRSVSFNGSQRDLYRNFDVQLFKIDCEINFTPQLDCQKISEIKQQLYCLRKEFDASRMKEKYKIEFRSKYRQVIENLERKIQVKNSRRRRSRKKYLAPLPPVVGEMEDLQNEIKNIGQIVASFRGRRDGDKHNKLQQTILAFLYRLASLETGSDKRKYCMMKELVEMMKQLENNAMENDEMAASCD